MKFSCPKCTTRYSIAEDKVPMAKTLRFSCKKCGNVIRLRKKSSSKNNKDTNSQTTRVTSAAEVAAMQAKSKSVTPPPPPKSSVIQWYVLIAGEQKGPLNEDDMRQLLYKRQIDRRSYAWRDGMNNWERLGAISEFKELANSVGDASWRIVAPIDPSTAQRISQQKPINSHHPLYKSQVQSTPSTTATLEEIPSEAELEFAQPIPLSQSVSKEQPELVPISQDPHEPDTIDDFKSEVESALPLAKSEATAPFVLPIHNTPSDSYTLPSSVLDTPNSLPSNSATEFQASNSDLLKVAAAIEDQHQGPIVFQQETSPPPLPDNKQDAPNVFPEIESLVTAPVTPNSISPETDPVETTQIFMTTAGLYERQRNQKIGIGIAASIILCIGIGFYLDSTGVWRPPGLGPVYEKNAPPSPNTKPVVKQPPKTAITSDLTPQETQALRRKLLGPGHGTESKKKRSKTSPKKNVKNSVIQDPNKVSKNQKEMLANVFGDERKKEAKISLQKPKEIQAPNLPDGLTAEAILQVISNNSLSIKLCMDQAIKKGEELKGRMDIEITIAPQGTVNNVLIATTRFKHSTIGRCARKRIKLWKFPPFNGQEVPVRFPYVLSAGF